MLFFEIDVTLWKMSLFFSEAPEVMDNIELEFMLKFLISVIGDQDLMEELRVKAGRLKCIQNPVKHLNGAFWKNSFF